MRFVMLLLFISALSLGENQPNNNQPRGNYPPSNGGGNGYGSPSPADRAVQIWDNRVFDNLGGRAEVPTGPAKAGSGRDWADQDDSRNSQQIKDINDRCRRPDRPMDEVRRCAQAESRKLDDTNSEARVRIEKKQAEPYRNANQLPDINQPIKDEGFSDDSKE